MSYSISAELLLVILSVDSLAMGGRQYHGLWLGPSIPQVLVPLESAPDWECL